MTHNRKLFLWGLLPIPAGYLRNALLAWGFGLYPLMEVAFLIGWGVLAYWLCDRSTGVFRQSAWLCAGGILMILLAWLCAGGGLGAFGTALNGFVRTYFNPTLHLLAGTVGKYFYSLMGERYNLLPVYAATWLIMVGISLLAMGLKKRQ